MEKRLKEYDIAYMKMALAMSELSYAIRSKVGCIIVSEDGQIISQGFNGTPSGMDNCCEIITCESHFNDGTCNCGCKDNEKTVYRCKSCEFCTLTTKKSVLHAESNAIAKCAKWSTASTMNATIYITLSPCIDCSKLIIQSGIKRVVYYDEYRNTEGIELLKAVGIKVEQIHF